MCVAKLTLRNESSNSMPSLSSLEVTITRLSVCHVADGKPGARERRKCTAVCEKTGFPACDTHVRSRMTRQTRVPYKPKPKSGENLPSDHRQMCRTWERG